MTESASKPEPGNVRWQYLVLWRYGGLCLAVVGLLMLGVGASGVQGTPISVSLLGIGFVSLVAGVVLPRIEGEFSAGREGVSGELVPVHSLDQVTFSVTGPATAPLADRLPGQVTLGDVWDALEANGFRVIQGALGKRLLKDAHGRQIILHGQELLGWRPASGELIAQLAAWGITPSASGRYMAPADVDPSYAAEPYSGVPLPPPES